MYMQFGGWSSVGVRADFVLNPPRWWARRPPPVAALRCFRATHPPSVLRHRDEMATGASQPNWAISNTLAHQQLVSQHPMETGTSGCAGRRRWSEATGGGLHTPRWRFSRGIPPHHSTKQLTNRHAKKTARRPFLKTQRHSIRLLAQKRWDLVIIHATRGHRIHLGGRMRAVGAPHAGHSHAGVVRHTHTCAH